MHRKKNSVQPRENLTNAELQNLLDKALNRFENWKTEVNRNPNPRMVHTLKNIMSIIDSISEITTSRTRYSYKYLSRQMAVLSHETAELNIAIMDALMEDDYIDAEEGKKINACLQGVIQASVRLIRIVQNAFGMPRQLEAPGKKEE